MRTLLIGLSLALMALAVSPANARYRHHHYSHNYSDRTYRQARYESCNCYFGYMGNSAGACTPVTSLAKTLDVPQLAQQWAFVPTCMRSDPSTGQRRPVSSIRPGFRGRDRAVPGGSPGDLAYSNRSAEAATDPP